MTEEVVLVAVGPETFTYQEPTPSTFALVEQGPPGMLGEQGEQGEQGEPGFPPELRSSGGFVQWKYPDEPGGAWRNLVPLTDIKGDQGDTGPAPEHEWVSTSVRFRLPGGLWGSFVDLKGEPGAVTSWAGHIGDVDPLIADIPGLQAAIDGKAATVHDHDARYYTEVEIDAMSFAISRITGLQAALDAKEALANKNVANGYAGLGADGLISVSLFPSSIVGGSPGDLVLTFRSTPPPGTLAANGAMVSRAAYADLDAAIYCGNANNATAAWGFRADSTGTTRSTTGTHIRLPDARGEFIRGWDNGRGVDVSRLLWALQADDFKTHTHGVIDPGHAHNYVGGPNGAGTGTVGAAGQNANAYLMGTLTALTGISIQSTGGSETRPRNIAALICVRY